MGVLIIYRYLKQAIEIANGFKAGALKENKNK